MTRTHKQISTDIEACITEILGTYRNENQTSWVNNHDELYRMFKVKKLSKVPIQYRKNERARLSNFYDQTLSDCCNKYDLNTGFIKKIIGNKDEV